MKKSFTNEFNIFINILDDRVAGWPSVKDW